MRTVLRTVVNVFKSSDEPLTCATHNPGSGYSAGVAGAAGSTEKTTVWEKARNKVRNKGNHRLKLFLDGFCAAALFALMFSVTEATAQTATITPNTPQTLNAGETLTFSVSPDNTALYSLPVGN